MGRSRTWIIVLIVVVLLASGVGVAYLVLPGLLKSKLEGVFARLHQRFGVAVVVDQVSTDFSGRISLPTLRFEWRGRSIASVDGVTVELDPLSFLYGAGVIESIVVDRVALALDDPEGELAQQLFGRAPPTEGEAPAREATPPRSSEPAPGFRLPLIRLAEVRELSGALTYRENTLRFEGGRVRAELVSWIVDAPEYLLEGSLTFDDANEARAQVTLARGKARGSISFSTPRAFHVMGRDLSFRAIHLDLPGRLGVEEVEIPGLLQIERVAIPFHGFSGGLAGMVRAALDEPVVVTRPRLVVDAEAFGRLLDEGSSVARRMRGEGSAETPREALGPTAPPPPAPTLPPLPDGVKVHPDSQRFQSFLRGALQGASVRLEAALKRANAVGLELPIRDLTIKDGEVRFDDALLRDNPALSNLTRLDSHVTRDDAGVFEAVLEYETGGSRLYKDRLRYRRDPAGSLSASIRLAHVAAYPFQDLLPAAVIVDKGTSIRGLDVGVEYDAARRTATVAVRAEVTGFHVFDERISSFDLRDLTFGSDLSVRFDFEAARVVVERGDLEFSRIPFRVTGQAVEIATCPKVELHVALPRIELAQLFQRLPRGLLPMLADARVSGDLEVGLDAGFDACDLTTLTYDVKPVTNAIEIESLGERVDFKAVQGRFLKEIVEGKDEKTGKDIVTTREFGPGTPGWAPLSLIPPDFVKVVTTTEDGSFFDHEGFSKTQMRKALIQDLQKLRFYRGASTISQQVVKNVFLTREKTVSRKLQELIITWQMEEKLEKDQILELYANVIELGRDVYGIKEAAQHYFCKRPRDLTLLECLFFSSILPNPKKYDDDFHHKKGKVSEGWRRQLEALLEIMVKREKITPEQKELQAPYEIKFHEGECDLVLEIDPVPGMAPVEGHAPGTIQGEPVRPDEPSDPEIED
jgi:hypothetical protein